MRHAKSVQMTRSGIRIVRESDRLPLTLRDYHRIYASKDPSINYWRHVNEPNILRGLRAINIARAYKIPTFFGALFIKLIRADGQVLDFGLASLRVVTTVGAAYLVDAMQNLVEPENMKYHGIGTGTAAESAGDTVLNAELTTAYLTDNTRAAGTTGEGATSNVFQSVATNTVDSAVTITEHGLFSAATVGSGVLLDRSVFAGIGLAINDSLETTYELTFATGG